MNINSLVEQIKIYENEYKSFVCTKKFPVYEIETKTVSLEIANKRGFEALATTYYTPKTNKHSLIVSTNMVLSKHLLFHEFTHIFDSEMYVKGDTMRYAGLSGFTEYHASQIELLQLLGASDINSKPIFTMNDVITTISGEKNLAQYIEEKQQHAISLFNRNDFPVDLSTLKSAIGILYNYYGLRSICELYAIDYTENIDNTAFLKYIPTQTFSVVNNLMHGWLSEEQIELSISLYLNIIFPLIQKYKLT